MHAMSLFISRKEAEAAAAATPQSIGKRLRGSMLHPRSNDMPTVYSYVHSRHSIGGVENRLFGAPTST
jgi:hypothetical protein